MLRACGACLLSLEMARSPQKDSNKVLMRKGT